MTTRYNCIIIDDEPKAIEMLARSLQELYPNIEIAAKCTFWQQALEALRNNTYDIVFVDISMPQKSGMELMTLVPGLTSEIIFVTAYSEYALNAFSLSASGYLLKPVKDTALVTTVDKALERTDNKKTAQQKKQHDNLPQKIAIPNNKGLDYIDINDIIYFEADKRYTRVFKKDNMLLSSYSIGRFKEMVEGHYFYLVHRSFLVNLNYIKRYESTGLLIMLNGKTIPVAKNTREDFLKMVGKVSKQ